MFACGFSVRARLDRDCRQAMSHRTRTGGDVMLNEVAREKILAGWGSKIWTITE